MYEESSFVGTVPGFDRFAGTRTTGTGRHGKDQVTKIELLYVLDGVEIPKSEVALKMNALDPTLIETIQVLKDGKAIESYGEKGKNGVIVITTKKKKLP